MSEKTNNKSISSQKKDGCAKKEITGLFQLSNGLFVRLPLNNYRETLAKMEEKIAKMPSVKINIKN